MEISFKKKYGKEYADLDNILEWYHLLLHRQDNKLFAIYDTSINEFLIKDKCLRDCAIFLLQLQATRKCGNLNTTHYTTCFIEWKDGHKDLVLIKSTNDIVDNEDDNIFFYGMSYNDIIQAYIDRSYCENEWKIVAITDVENG